VSSPAIPGQPLGSPPGDDGWEWDGDGWDPVAALSEREIAALDALDQAGQWVDEWAEVSGDTVSAGVDAGLGGLRSGLGDDGRFSAPGGGPAEALPGLTPRRLGAGGGFDAGGVADRLPPGPVLAGSDDELAGLMIAWRRVASWAASGELAAVAELSRRRQAQVAAGADPHLTEHVGDEVAMVLTLTAWTAGTLVDRAEGLARLPKTMAALRTGQIDVPKALVILGELSGLSGVHAARVEAAVISGAAGWTTGELRRAVRRQVIAADPAAARRRKERAGKQARVERWAEDAGTAALAGRDLPPAEVLAADAHLTGWAKRLKAAGLDGSLDQLRARVYLALLNGQPLEALLPAGSRGCSGPISARDQGGPADSRSQAEPVGDSRHREPTSACGQSDPAGGRFHGGVTSVCSQSDPTSACGQSDATGPHSPGRPADPSGLSVRGSVNLVLPLSTWLGWSASPGEVAGFGPLDAADSRALAAALTRDPATRWCVTVTGPDGRAVAHGCAQTGPGRPPLTQTHGHAEGPDPPATPGSRPWLASTARRNRTGPAADGLPLRGRTWLAGITLAWLERGECSHRRESPGYRPSRALTHLIQARQVTCTAPGCRRPATSCDFEHTIPYHLGGRTCECNGGPCCRRHHRAKQSAGWELSQPRPGTFVWTTPHGRSYHTEPDLYPV
jgi:hypothetical protein